MLDNGHRLSISCLQGTHRICIAISSGYTKGCECLCHIALDAAVSEEQQVEDFIAGRSREEEEP
jgi:hypothetical protein